MFFVTALLFSLFLLFLALGYKNHDSTQKMLAWILLIAAFGTGFILFLALKAGVF